MFPRGFFPSFFTPGYFGPTGTYVNNSPIQDAGRGAGVEFEGSNYPFVEPSDDVEGILADLWVAHYVTNAVGPLHIAQMFNFDRLYAGVTNLPGQHLTDLYIKDANGLMIVDTTTATAYRGEFFGNRFFVHEWTFPDRICRAIQHTKLSSSREAGQSVSSSLVPVNGILDERTNDLMPARVLSIKVGDIVLNGDIILQPGYNMEIAQNPASGLQSSIINTTSLLGAGSDTIVVESTIQFAAIAGSGAGLYPGCIPEDEIGLRTINKIKPTDKGDFHLNGEKCIFVAPPFVTGDPSHIIPYALQIGNHCGQCRPCGSYVDAYRELRDIHANLNSIAGRAEHDRDLLRDLDTQIETVIAGCIKSITGSVVGGKDFQATSVAVSVQITNITSVCYKNVNLTVDMGFSGGGTPYVAHAGGFDVDATGKAEPWYGAAYPTTTKTWTEIGPSSSVRIHFVLVWLATPPATPPTGTFTLTATATCDGGTIPVGGTAETLTISEAIS